MSLSQSVSKRRVTLIANHGFLLLTLMFGVLGHYCGWTALTVACFWGCVAIVLLTFYPLYVKTGLWRLAHTRIDRMDEREISQTLGALRQAYVLFSIIVLSLILIATVLEFSGQSLQLVVFWVLLYLAHTLPSSILAWTEAGVPVQSEEE